MGFNIAFDLTEFIRQNIPGMPVKSFTAQNRHVALPVAYDNPNAEFPLSKISENALIDDNDQAQFKS